MLAFTTRDQLTFGFFACEISAAVGNNKSSGAISGFSVQLEQSSHSSQAVVVEVLLQRKGDLKMYHCIQAQNTTLRGSISVGLTSCLYSAALLALN